MASTKRVLIATIMGFICGIVCMLMASSDPSQPIDLSLKLSIIFSRGIMGFMIGISALKMKWWLHGIILGLIGSIPMVLPILNDLTIMVATVVMGIIYGFVIELVTSVIFKAKQIPVRQ